MIVPGAGEVVDADGAMGHVDDAGGVVLGAEVLAGVHGTEAGEVLQGVVEHQAVSEHVVGDDGGVGGHVEVAVGLDEAATIVLVEELLCPDGAFLGCHHTGEHVIVGFKAGEHVVMQEWVEGLDHFDVGVHVDATLVVEGIEAHIVGDEGEFAGLVGLADVGHGVDVEVVLVPLLESVVGTIFFPAFDAADGQLGLLASAEPAVMDYFGNH